ncbi:bleomycin resistance protein [Kribbella turkmenica]|uniref:Bleomycin resistance protein n=1 Tax=Kribbella turkmenica TaxID=2530375 RepID=A0A4R4X7U7_9ACTN|nr:VOC family protein [Kribbella turkmenica]TDD26530.1 bleomycin resistance protein [Kribbella turkmenica]
MAVDDVFPIVTSADLGRMLPFYRDVLGGEVHYQFPPEGPPAYVGLRFGTASFGLGHDPDHQRPAGGTPPIALWLYVDDCDAGVERIRAAGGRIVEEPADQPWGERIARAEDPDGNQLILGQRAAHGG